MPILPTARATKAPRLIEASTYFAAQRAAALGVAGSDPSMQFRTEITDLMQVGGAVQEAVDFGVNANTLQKDERAWEFWETICEKHGTSPLRTSEEARNHPERNSHLLAAKIES